MGKPRTRGDIEIMITKPGDNKLVYCCLRQKVKRKNVLRKSKLHADKCLRRFVLGGIITNRANKISLQANQIINFKSQSPQSKSHAMIKNPIANFTIFEDCDWCKPGECSRVSGFGSALTLTLMAWLENDVRRKRRTK